MRRLKLTGCGAGLVASVLAVGVGAAAGQASTAVVRTYDVRIVGSVTTTAPDTVFVEKATHAYTRVKVRSFVVSGRPAALSIDRSERGVMSGEIDYQRSGPAPCSQSKRFRGAARLNVSGVGSRSVGASGDWAGAPGGARLVPREWKCPGLADVAVAGFPWEYAKGVLTAQFDSSGGVVFWMLPPARGRLPFPMDRLRAGKSFAAEVSGTTNDGFLVKTGTIRVTFTARR